MISFDDIADMACLTRAEMDALAEHEHLTDFDAAMMAEYLMHLPKGPQEVQQMICEDISAALHSGDALHARSLFAVLRGFVEQHPESVRGAARR